MTGGPPASVRREARVSLSALESNLVVLLEADDSFVLDARADAYGHGAEKVVATALRAGVTTIRVSPGQATLPGVKRSSLMTTASRRTLIGDEAYGVGGRTLPVMSLVGEVIAVKPTESGAGVSYGYSYRTTDATTLALVALGYADGVPRLASNRARVLLGGALHPIVGRVAMDQFVVDCGDTVPAVGDHVVLFGKGAPSAAEFAKLTQRSALQLTSGLGSRILRVYS